MNKSIKTSDSITDGIETLSKCRRCGAMTQLDHGTCINCFLREGLETKGEGSREAFESVLVEDDVTDTEWRLGHYEILEEIGRGGMGVIYRARQQHSRRIVAVKRILAHQVNSHETLVRFRREAEAVASLDHPNILPIYEVSESEEALPFFSMKYATGGSLRMAAPSLRAKPRECVRLMAKIARAIAFAHRKGILHRDLQPGNILLDENGEPMVSDFGLAKRLDQTSDLTRTLETLGTPGYIAPEQAECRTADLTSGADIYSLGAILFYLLTGRPPFIGPNVLQVIHQAAATPAPRLRSLAPSLDRDLETIVARCLESDPAARYQSAGALAEDLKHWLRHEPIQARRVGVFTRGRKWVRRNPTTTVLIAALVVLAAAIVAVMVWKNESPHPMPSLPAGIAVLPLQNLSEEKENAYFADGIQDELLTNLSKIRDLKVISRTSVMQYKSGITRNLKEIAQQLGVSNVVEGSVRRSGDHVRVSVQLIDAKTNRHLWAQNYDRTLADSVALQGDLATEIAAALGGTLSPQEKARVQAKPTENTAAYDAYLRGRAFAARSHQKSYEDNAIQSYQEAVRLDPGFALAWARLSIAVGHNGWDPSPAQLAAVKDAAGHALRLAPDLPETHLAVGYYRYGQHDYIGALAEFQQAEQGLPNNAEVIEAIALVQRRLGNWEEAITGLRRTIELDPRYHDAYENLAGTYRWMRRFPETLATVDQLLAWEPNDVIALGRKAAALWAMGDLQAVEPLLTNPGFDSYDRGVHALLQRHYAAAIEIFSAPPPSNLAPSPSTSERQLFLGLSQQRAGDVGGARVTYQKAVQDFQRDLEKVVPGSWAEAWLRTCLGRAYAGMGEADSAIAEGGKAMAIDPASTNPVDGPVWEEKMANVYALLGDADHAIPILKRLLRTTYAGAITPALLRLDPIWDQIRNDPRFQELAEEGKPIPEKNIAVLPFENLGADPENASFTDGVQDEILNDLTKVADLKVISRTSVTQYKAGAKRNLRQIANELGVTHVVEGSVQRAANRVRISTQLIDARTNRHLWQERYDRPLDNVFAIQSDIAHAIAVQLQVKLSPKEKAAIEERPTSDLAAYDLYLKAKELRYNARFNPGRREKALFQAVQLLEQAVARDPTFLLAHYQLAFTNDLIYFANYDHTETRLALVQTSIDALVRLQPDAGETRLAKANHFFWGYLNYRAAREELVKAQRELPNNAQVFQMFGQMNRWEGRWEEASQNLQRSVELDPRNASTITDLAWVYIALRKYEEADALATRLQALEPRSPILRCGRGFIGLEARADTGSLRAVLDTIESESPQSATEVADLSFRLARYERDPVAAARALANMPREGKIDNNYAPFPHTWYEGLLAKLRQDVTAAHSAFTAARAETDKLVHAQRGNAVPLGVLALVDAELGDKEKAIAEARTACDMLPSTKNALDGVWLMTNLARIYALTGENDLALEQLEVLSKLASSWFGFSYGDLHLNPEWDSLRGDPRFEKLVEESKKPVVLDSLQPVPSGIAVLPFENLSADPDNAFFADGVQAEVLNNLAKIADLKVISRTSVMQYKTGAKRNVRQIANELGVAHVVEGSVRRAGNRVRVSAELIDAKTDTHLWAESYDRPLDDVFAIQSAIAKAIAGQLKAKLSPSQTNALAAAPTHDAEAYDFFLKGEYQERQAESTYEVKTYDRAATFYRQALARDPNFVLASARLAYSRLNRHWFLKRLTSAELGELKSDIERALAIAPDSPDAHLALGLFHYWGRHDFDSALREFDRVIELQPSNAVSREYRAAIYRRRGEWRRSLAEYERALELDPRDVWKSDQIGATYNSLRRWSEAEHWLKHALALDPHHVGAAYRLNLTYIASTGDIQRARRAWEGIPNDKTDVGEGPPLAYEIIIPQMVGEIEYLDVLERHFPEALKPWDAAPTNTAEGRLAQLKARIGIQLLAGQCAAAKSEAEEARALLEPRLVKRAPQDRTSLSESAWVFVCLGRNADALRIAREAAESMPIEKDAILGVNFLVGLAQIEAHTGQAEEAIKTLRQLLTMPAGEYISVARLKIDPVWDPLRNDPGFQKLLSEPEPETVYK